ncbi:MAG: NAD(P)/FAD-dependent oxidoreductase [Pseudomonadota bacterium]
MLDYLIVGAGPAGLSAALTAVELGVRPLVVDNRPEPGGNIYAFLGSSAEYRAESLRTLGTAYSGGLPLIRRFLDGVSRDAIDYRPSSKLWHLEQDRSFAVSGPGGNIADTAKNICLATGAQERPAPMPGWTLPGVMGVGAAQLLLKSGGQLPSKSIVIIGNGPLPLLLASQLRNVGSPPKAVIEPRGSVRYKLSIPGYLGAFAAPITSFKGLMYLASQKLSETHVYTNADDIEVLGTDCAVGVGFYRNGKRHEVDADLILIHDGIVPNANPISAAGINSSYNAAQQALHADASSSIKVAGDAAAILGAKSAELTGRIRTLETFGQRIPTSLSYELWRQRKFRTFLDEAYPPVKFAGKASDDTIICRCELSTAKQVRNTALAVGPDANRIKTALRCGMGPCQGRMCGYSIMDLIHDETNTPYPDITPQRCRSPILPVSFGDLASE